MKKRLSILIYIVVLILLANIVLGADPVKYDSRDYDSPGDYFSEDGASYAEFKSGGGKVSEIPDDKLADNLAQIEEAGDLDQLDSKQIGSNLQKLGGKYNKLNQEELSKVVKQNVPE